MRLSEIRAACETATQGPWCTYRQEVFAGVDTKGSFIALFDAANDADFAALARKALPALLKALDAVGDRGEILLALESAGIEVDE